MTNTNVTNFRQNAFEYFNLAVEYNDVITVNTKNGNAAVNKSVLRINPPRIEISQRTF